MPPQNQGPWDPSNPSFNNPEQADGNTPGMPQPAQQNGNPAQAGPSPQVPQPQPSTEQLVQPVPPTQPAQYAAPTNQPQPIANPGWQQPAQPQAYGQVPPQPGTAYQAQNAYASQQSYPQQPQGYQTYQNPYQSAMPSKIPGKKLVVLAVALFGLILLVGVAAVVYIQTKPTPDGVFKAAVANSLSTRQVKQSMDAGSSGSQELQYDLSKEKDPRVYAHAKFNVFSTAMDGEQYASLKNSYIKMNKAGDVLSGNSPLSGFQGKWMQDRKDGKPVIGTQTDLSVATLMPQSYTYLFGDWIFGNFSSKDKQDLQDYIIGQKVYAYDAKSVVKKKVGGEDVFVYNVTEDSAKKTEMNKKVAAIWGVDSSEVTDALSGLPATSKATLYVSVKSKQLIEADAESNNVKVTNKYTDYNKLSVPSEPSVQADYSTFVQTSNIYGF